MKGIILVFFLSAISVSCTDKSGARVPASETEPSQVKIVDAPVETDSHVQTECFNGPKEAIDVCEGLNRIRSRNGAPVVRSDRHLTQVAMAYAREMYERGNLTHGDFKARMRHAGVPMPVAENIAHGQRTPEHVLQTWAGSPGHFGNMVNPAYKIVGVGHYENYWVQIFSGSER